jgi:hypothetical protein
MKLFLIAVILLIGLSGCGIFSPEKTSKTPAEERKEFFDKYEKTFDPSAYDKEEDSVNARNNREKISITSRESEAKQPELISGFRIQLLLTPDITEANNIKNEVTPLIKDVVYIIFESPYYKVRIGDCRTRATANQLLKSLLDLGYKNAWIVPDRVNKNAVRPDENN